MLNLGVDFSISKEHWTTLTNRIQEILSGQQSLLTIDTSIDKLARNYAQKILTAKQEDKRKSSNDYRTVNLNTLNIYNPRSIGCEHVTLETLRFLELDKKFANLGFSPLFNHKRQSD